MNANLATSIGPGATKQPLRRCPHCGRRADLGRGVNAWTKALAVLKAARAPMSLRELYLATGLPEANLSMALKRHATVVDRTGTRGSYRYALRRSE
jgi:hypothetical protein